MKSAYRAGWVSNSLTKAYLGTLFLSAANGVTFGLTGNTLTASVNPSTVSHLFFPPEGAATSLQQVNSILSFQRFQVQAPVTFTRVDVPFVMTISTSADAATAALAITSGACIYTRSGVTLSPIVGSTGSTTLTHASNSANWSSISGGRFATWGLATYLTPGEYFLGIFISTTNDSSIGTATTQLANTISMHLGSTYSASGFAQFGAVPNSTNQYPVMRGLCSITISATSMTFQQSQITGTGTGGVAANFPIFLRNI